MRAHHSVVLEALRLYPTVPQFPRECTADDVVVTCSDGTTYDVPKGTICLVSQQGLNRDANTWDRPNDFVPDRFAAVNEVHMAKPVGNPHTPDLKFGFVPFGAAGRSCVGQRLAMVEAVAALATIAKNVDFELETKEPMREVADITMGLKDGVVFRVRTRC